MITMKKRISYLSTARVIGILLVVLGHSYPFNVPLGQGFEFLRTFIYSFHMPLFVFLSGFLAAKSNHIPKDYIANRAGKLLIPYFVLSLAFFLPKVLLQGYLNDTVSFSFTYLLRSELIPRENVWGHFWFLPVIFYLGVFSVLLKTVFQKPWARTIILICSYLVLWLPKTTDWFALEDLRLNLFWYVLGYILSDCDGLERLIKKKFWLLGIPLAWVLLWLKVSLPALIPLLMIGAVLCVSSMIKAKCKIYAFLDRHSFTIFLLSCPVQAAAEIILNRILHLPVWLCVTGMFAVGIAGPIACIFLIRWIEKYIPLRRIKQIVGM